MFDALFEPKTWLRLGLLSLIAGVFVLKSAFTLIGEQNKAAAWPSARGRVDDVEIVRESETAFFPKVSYTYAVGRKTYTGTSVWLGDPILYKTVGQATAAVPAQGMMIPVRYDPTANDRCTLRTDGDTRLFSTTKGRWGLGLGVLGVASMIFSFYLNRSQQSWHAA